MTDGGGIIMNTSDSIHSITNVSELRFYFYNNNIIIMNFTNNDDYDHDETHLTHLQSLMPLRATLKLGKFPF